MDEFGLKDLLSGIFGAALAAFATTYFLIYLQKLKVIQENATIVYKSLAKFLGELESFRQDKKRFYCECLLTTNQKDNKNVNLMPGISLLESKFLLQLTLNNSFNKNNSETWEELDDLIDYVDTNHKSDTYATDYVNKEIFLIEFLNNKITATINDAEKIRNPLITWFVICIIVFVIVFQQLDMQNIKQNRGQEPAPTKMDSFNHRPKN